MYACMYCIYPSKVDGQYYLAAGAPWEELRWGYKVYARKH